MTNHFLFSEKNIKIFNSIFPIRSATNGTKGSTLKIKILKMQNLKISKSWKMQNRPNLRRRQQVRQRGGTCCRESWLASTPIPPRLRRGVGAPTVVGNRLPTWHEPKTQLYIRKTENIIRKMGNGILKMENGAALSLWSFSPECVRSVICSTLTSAPECPTPAWGRPKAGRRAARGVYLRR